MSIWTAKVTLDGKRECARCHKMFIPKDPDQKYGPTCARKMAVSDKIDEGLTPEQLEDEGLA